MCCSSCACEKLSAFLALIRAENDRRRARSTAGVSGHGRTMHSACGQDPSQHMRGSIFNLKLVTLHVAFESWTNWNGTPWLMWGFNIRSGTCKWKRKKRDKEACLTRKRIILYKLLYMKCTRSYDSMIFHVMRQNAVTYRSQVEGGACFAFQLCQLSWLAMTRHNYPFTFWKRTPCGLGSVLVSTLSGSLQTVAFGVAACCSLR